MVQHHDSVPSLNCTAISIDSPHMHRDGANYLNLLFQAASEPFFSRMRKLPCIFAALFVCYSSRLRLRDSLLRPCYDFLLFFTTQTRPVHRETDSGDEKFITPINKIHNPILGYVWEHKFFHSHWRTNHIKGINQLYFELQEQF